jgi:hypothetical protein
MNATVLSTDGLASGLPPRRAGLAGRSPANQAASGSTMVRSDGTILSLLVRSSRLPYGIRG